MVTCTTKPRQPGESVDVVLGAGGVKGFGHIGVWRKIVELGIPVGTVTGASVGSIIAAFVTNGYGVEELARVFHRGLNNRMNLGTVISALSWGDPLSVMIGGPVDLTQPMREMVREFGLKPNKQLKIVAFDLIAQEPVVFEGEDYDLATALTASCALPSVLRPKWFQDGARLRLLADGALFHYNPTCFSTAPAIVSTLKPASEWPREVKYPIDWYFHMRELYFPIAGHRRVVDPNLHIVVDCGLPEVAGLNFGVSAETCDRMIADGYKTAHSVLTDAIARGRLPKPQTESVAQ